MYVINLLLFIMLQHELMVYTKDSIEFKICQEGATGFICMDDSLSVYNSLLHPLKKSYPSQVSISPGSQCLLV